MSIASVALPGSTRTVPTSAHGSLPGDTFRGPIPGTRAFADMAVGMTGSPLESPERYRVKKTHVCLFDFSVEKERKQYETLMPKLANSIRTGMTLLDTHKNIMTRADGSTYWCCYIEYSILEKITGQPKDTLK